MKRWMPTEAMLRAISVAAIGLVVAVALGSPVAAVLAAPFAWHVAMAVRGRPKGAPHLAGGVLDGTLHEGRSTTVPLTLADPAGIEHVTRLAVPTAHVATEPAGGRVGRLLPGSGRVDTIVSARRWGRRRVGHERVWLTTRWAGYRYGPIEMPGRDLTVLPEAPALATRAEMPQPQGLVGAHRAAREAPGTEFAGIRPFQAGDRLRRVNWRVSSRSEQLHVTTSRAEVDGALLLVVDALADLGPSGGVDGATSSLDIAVRAAAALAEHHTRRGDRVGLRVIGLDGATVAYGSGRSHLRRVLGTLTAIRPGAPHEAVLERLRLRAGAGTTVIVLSPMLTEQLATATAEMVRRGLPTLVVDTLPSTLTAADLAVTSAELETAERDDRRDPRHHVAVRQAWRMRTIEREQVLSSLRAVGCPVVRWTGPGALDDVLRRLARRASMPRLR